MGLDFNEEEALKWYRKAAEVGNESAQCRLGWAYDIGEFDLVTDKEEALKWWRKVAALRRYSESDGPTNSASWAW